jgi:hypothetical protein
MSREQGKLLLVVIALTDVAITSGELKVQMAFCK